ncbi:hypothetical protein ACQYAD_13090 [Neobacillus sp. SM06]|uniref:hypothetical protein n=1 Tax=Neobacillus sp. SM06 TaxID=3422492 RepID=UPI003D272D4E
MVTVMISFFIIAFFEWNELKRKNRKKRTYVIVFAIMGMSLLYCLFSILLFRYIPSPNDLIQFLFQPLQKKILG